MSWDSRCCFSSSSSPIIEGLFNRNWIIIKTSRKMRSKHCGLPNFQFRILICFLLHLQQALRWTQEGERLSQQWTRIPCGRRIFGHPSAVRSTGHGRLRSPRQIEHSHVFVAVLSSLRCSRWVQASHSPFPPVITSFSRLDGESRVPESCLEI